jgi:hypothetical protein
MPACGVWSARRCAPALLLLALTPCLACADETNLLKNPAFEGGLDGWTVELGDATGGLAAQDGAQFLRITLGDEGTVGYPRYWQELDCAPGDWFEAAAHAKGEGIRAGIGAYLAVEFLDAAGLRLMTDHAGAAPPGEGFAPLRMQAVAPAKSARVRLCLVLNGRGEATFRAPVLRQLGRIDTTPPQGPATLRATDRIAVPALWGFGAEDDGWSYSAENTSRGVTEEDFALREARIAAMDPDWVRMFVWYPDWNPSGDWTTFDWETDGMRSHVRSLAVYQRLGASVTLTGVEWSVPTPWAQPEKMAHAIGALFEHLIRERGFTCIKHWILTNEPNTHFLREGGTFEGFVRLHTLVRAEFQRRGLDVQVLGSDDTDGWRWFQQCVEDPTHYAESDAFVSHRYLRTEAIPLMGSFFQERLDLLRERAGSAPPKPLIIGEFGFQDARADGPLVNPVIEEYDYALWTMAFVLEGLHRGVAGFNFWCLHETYYPNGWLMKYGLWNFKDKDWSLRPVFHAFSLFPRFSEAGDAVHTVDSTHPQHLRAARIGARVFWVNQSTEPLVTQLEGLNAKQAVIFTEQALPVDTRLPAAQPLEGHTVTLPARSFGYFE